MSEVACGRMSAKSIDYIYQEFMEKKLIEQSDLVIAISESLKNYIISETNINSNIFVVPNAVESNKFIPLKKNNLIQKKYDLQDKIVLGYLGQIRKLEGLHYLINSMTDLANRHNNIKLLIIGEGPDLDHLKELVIKRKLSKYISFLGNIPHDEIIQYYSVIDIIILPRVNNKVNNLVTPLKPLEAMSCGKVVIASNLKALKELITDGETGLLFKAGDVSDLVNKCSRVIENDILRTRLSQESRKWVIRHRDWKKISNLYSDIYSSKLLHSRYS